MQIVSKQVHVSKQISLNKEVGPKMNIENERSCT